MNKTRKITFAIILFFELFLAYFIINSTIIYRGLHNITSFLALCFVLGIDWYRVLLKNSLSNHHKARLVILAVLTVGIPITLFVTQPEFTYEEGKELIIEEYNEYQNLKFSEYDRGMNTIPVINNPKRVLVRNREYYYRIITDTGYSYFHVNSISGKVGKLRDEYWAE